MKRERKKEPFYLFMFLVFTINIIYIRGNTSKEAAWCGGVGVGANSSSICF